jgi:ferredoxin
VGRPVKAAVDREKCIGAGNCVEVAPGVFRLDEEKKAVVFDAALADADRDTLVEAADVCPTLAITLWDDEDTQIYPV